jgi:DNA-binding MarR family transcriptional regulator
MPDKQKKNKQKNEKQNLLKYAESIAIIAKGSGLDKEFYEKTSEECKKLTAFFGISKQQCALLCMMLNMSFSRASVDIEMISDYIGIDPISAATFIPELDSLVKKKLLRRQNSEPGRRRRSKTINCLEFNLPRYVLDSLSGNKKLWKERTKEPDQYELLADIRKVFIDFYEADSSYAECFDRIRRILADNPALDFVKQLNTYQLKEFDLLFFLLLCTEILDDEEALELNKGLRFLVPEVRKQMQIRKEFITGKHHLLQCGLVVPVDDQFRRDQFVTLSEKGQEIMFGDDLEMYPLKRQGKKTPDTILSSEIPAKTLYFSSKEQENIDFLADVLSRENHRRLLTRLEDAGMRTGVTVLFYGSPGTGKTETAYQLARQTGRDIRMVSISQTKNKYFGESERLIKKLFDDYRRLVERSEVTPILLFNEADGVLGTRRSIGNSSVDQTENAIQNIILQEMEDLKGIMLATTNLNSNLDKAFERRFLYKIRFEKPQPEARMKIWQDKISNLSESDAMHLSRNFDLSGGQIENVARKCMMRKVLYDILPALAELEDYCKEEIMTKIPERKRIGF